LTGKLTPSLERILKKLGAGERAFAVRAMKETVAALGRPHEHSGLGIRRYKKYMECRCGITARLVFKIENDEVIFVFYGNHNEVKNFIG
jgi:mRNA-degrading endonuclease RelE of RelBE toxin-antitoxin system